MKNRDFGVLVSNSGELAQSFDCIYFMQSAHYVGDDEFEGVFTQLRNGLKPKKGTIVIQARNMTPEWYPWAFPFEWKEKVEEALVATSMFGRADKYKKRLQEMEPKFSKVTVNDYKYLVEVDTESYWQRLEYRWIPTFMAEHIIPADLHRAGIDAMKKRFRDRGETKVTWVEKFSVVVAHV